MGLRYKDPQVCDNCGNLGYGDRFSIKKQFGVYICSKCKPPRNDDKIGCTCVGCGLEFKVYVRRLKKLIKLGKTYRCHSCSVRGDGVGNETPKTTDYVEIECSGCGSLNKLLYQSLKELKSDSKKYKCSICAKRGDGVGKETPLGLDKVLATCFECHSIREVLFNSLVNLRKLGKNYRCSLCSLGVNKEIKVTDKIEVICVGCEKVNIVMRGDLKKPSRRGKAYRCITCAIRGDNVGEETPLANDKVKQRCGGCGKYNLVVKWYLDRLLREMKSYRCRNCNTTQSPPEFEIIKWLINNCGIKANQIEHGYNNMFDDRRSLDLYIPHLRLAIEYNGLYYHSEKFRGKNYHYDKTVDCQKKDVFLFHIWEDDWRYKKSIVQSKLRHLTNCNNNKVIYARKTSIKLVSCLEKDEFYLKTHIQGTTISTVTMGLYQENMLVACMSFRRRDKHDKVWELVRYATLNRVVGGFSKLLAHFKKTNAWEKIISFADLSWSKGDLYEKTGWVVDGMLKPDYRYLINGKRFHKFGFRHKQLGKKLKTYNPDISEHQNMLNNGILRVYDCGKIRYVCLS